MKKFKKVAIMALCLSMLLSMVACSWLTPNNSGSGNSGPSSGGSGNGNPGGNASMNDLDALTVKSSNIPLKLWYDEQAPFDNECSPEASMMAGQDIGWQNWSLPIGNGYFGANVFGRVETERVQITEKTLSNPWQIVKTVNGTPSWPQVAGLNNFSETYIDFGHSSAGVTNYSRALDLRTSVASTSYNYNGASYSRDYFVSYPDKALVIRLDAQNGPLSFTLRPTIPFEQSYMDHTGDGISKTGTVVSSVENGVGCIELSGTLGYYDVDFVGYYRVYTTGGTVSASTVASSELDASGNIQYDGVIKVDGATSAIIVATFGTDYELCVENFENGQYSHNKQTATTDLDDAREKVGKQLKTILDGINGKSVDEAYDYLIQRHLSDYQNLFGRVDLDLNCNTSDLALTTDKLLEKYNSGSHSSYLEALLYQYGRYLIIASSREGSLPANLQGVWNCYNTPAWSSGYWSNINIQMNYWHVFSANLVETFIPYVDYNAAYMSVAEKHADDVIREHNPGVYDKDGGNGWTMGVAGNPFFFNSDRSCGNLGLLTQLFWEYYEFTKDEDVLKTVYDVLVNAARFVTKCVKEYDGKYLVEYCDSPEMYVNGVWYYTTGTTYAQSLAYINNYGALECAKALGIDLNDSTLLSSSDYSILKTIMEQIDKYDPIIVGLSGQIKEFREEDYYGSMGNPNHRHISQLVGMFPGNIINSGTEAWMDAALVSLHGRNEGLVDWPNGSTDANEASIVGWAWAHKQALYARAGEGDLAQEMIAGNLRNSTLQNLLMVCGKIFQIEASCGTTAAIGEMLLQSDEEFIEILPAIPTNWDEGSFTGMVARGNFEVSVAWDASLANKINILSRNGGPVSIKYPGFSNVTVYNSAGESVNYDISADKVITFDTVKGETYYITGFAAIEKIDKPTEFGFDRVNLRDFNLTWNKVADAAKYNVYVAYENAPKYTFVGSTTETSFNLQVDAGKENVRKTFVVTAVSENGTESKRALCYSNPIDANALELYSLSWSNSNGKVSATAVAHENAGFARLYEKVAGSGNYILVSESHNLTVSADYDATKSYALTVVSKYTGQESDYMALTPGNNASNMLNGKDSVTKKNDSTVETSFDLENVYTLNELRLYVDSAFAGSSLKVERLYGGEWYTVANLTSSQEISALISGSSNRYIAFALQNAKANKVRVTVTCTAGAVGDITLTGSIVNGESVDYVNVFDDKQFVPSSDASGNAFSGYGYDTLTDGIIYQEYNGRYSSKQNGGKVEATIDLSRIYNLSELKIYLYKDGLSKFGTGITVQVLFNDVWITVVDCTEAELANYLVDNPDGSDWLVFNLGDVYARKVKFTIPGQTSSGWTTIYEIECKGVKSTAVDPTFEPEPEPDPDLIQNIFDGKEFIPTTAAKDKVLAASWWKGGGYEDLTDGIKNADNAPGRFATVMSTEGMMDATIDLGASYALYTLKFYLYEPTQSTTALQVGTDLLIQVYSNGQWVDAITCENNAAICEHLVAVDGTYNNYLEFDLDGIEASKVRVYISGSDTGSGITYEEFECTAKATD